jgi:hypothetical protein
MMIDRKPEWKIFYNQDPNNLDEWRCNYCPPGAKTYSCKNGSGYTNLVAHMKQHPHVILPALVEHRASVGRALNHGNTLLNYCNFIGSKGTNKGSMFYNWLELVVMTDQPMSFVDNPYVQKCCRFGQMSSKTLRKYFLRVGYLVSLKIAIFLPDTFGLMLDGWSSKHFREHYVVIHFILAYAIAPVVLVHQIMIE